MSARTAFLSRAEIATRERGVRLVVPLELAILLRAGLRIARLHASGLRVARRHVAGLHVAALVLDVHVALIVLIGVGGALWPKAVLRRWRRGGGGRRWLR